MDSILKVLESGKGGCSDEWRNGEMVLDQRMSECSSTIALLIEMGIVIACIHTGSCAFGKLLFDIDKQNAASEKFRIIKRFVHRSRKKSAQIVLQLHVLP